MAEHDLDIARKDPVDFGGHSAPHDLQRIDREEWVSPKLSNIVSSNESFGLQLFVPRLVFDAS
jgi:hypothetical protein